jgi:nucleoside-diphosphate-sugar epimerase
MIVGNGLLASAFLKSDKNYDKVVIFASGVSDSKQIDINEFNREESLILKTINENKDLKIIYFSSMLAGIKNTHYYNHKLKIEKLIIENASDYIIFRAPQIIGNTGNKNNIVNAFKYSILYEDKIEIFTNVKRALIDVDDLVNIVNYCIKKTTRDIINISNIEKISVYELFKKISHIIHKCPAIHLIHGDSNDNWDIENSEIVNEAIQFLNINHEGYTDKTIKKYIN